ncbi:MAG: CidA/LrgA family protein [Alistipes inops]
MILLFAALCGKVVKRKQSDQSPGSDRQHRTLFLPAGVGIVNAMDILSQSWQAVLTACAVSTVAVIVTVACTQSGWKQEPETGSQNPNRLHPSPPQEYPIRTRHKRPKSTTPDHEPPSIRKYSS